MTIKITRQQHDRLIVSIVQKIANAEYTLQNIDPEDRNYDSYSLSLLSLRITLAALEQKPFTHACEVKLFRGSPRTVTETCGPCIKGAFPLFTRIFEVKP